MVEFMIMFLVFFYYLFLIYLFLLKFSHLNLFIYLWWRHPRQFSVLFLFYLFLHPLLQSLYQKQKKKIKTKHQRVSGWEEVRMITTDICCVHQFTILLHKKKKIYKIIWYIKCLEVSFLYSMLIDYIEIENMEKDNRNIK